MKRKFSVKSRIVGLMVLCWLLPLMLMTGVNIYYISSSHFENKISKQMEQLKFNDRISSERLEKVVDASRQASYDGTLVQLHDDYKKERIPRRKLISSSMYYLGGAYSRENTMKAAVLWFWDDPTNLSCSTYNTGEGGTYQLVREYWNADHKEVAKLAKTLDTKTKFYSSGGRLYLVRNLLDTSYNEIATLVILLNKSYCFENYSVFPENTSVTLQVDECTLQIRGKTVSIEETGMDEMGGNAGYTWKNSILSLYNQVRAEEHTLTSFVRFDDSSAFTLFSGYRTIMIGMVVCLIPLLLLVLYIFHRHVTNPIQSMMDGAAEIEKGNLGYQLSTAPESTEFHYLAESFNTMSQRLKYQFDHIYAEELALRDARIMALQSHINPHFMNNTLEIINWEARLSGNQKVSQMIEALATLMDAGIDRKKRPEVLLSEEMIYVNAYLYIIAERLGKRLTIKKELPTDIMEYKVPRLILQPVIENAIEHGVVKNGQGTVVISGRIDSGFLYLEIENQAEMTAEDEEKVKRLLDFDYDTSKESSGNMGIANVNQRLRILYGEPCGLRIKKTEDGHVIARLTIHVEQENKIVQEITD